MYSSVVHVCICGECFAIWGAVVCTVGGDEWVADHAVTSLETNFWLEGVRIDRANHLEGYVWAVEETCIIRGSTLITDNIVVLIGEVCCVRINVDLDATVDGANREVASVINLTDGRTTSAS